MSPSGLGGPRPNTNFSLTATGNQFILLSSPDPGIIERSVNDLIYQAEVSQWVGSDVINIHGGGAYGDKEAALKRLARQVDNLPDNVRIRLTLENDDRTYTPADLSPWCRDLELPLVYDVHHHRCLSDGNSIDQTTEAAIASWNREPLFHLSSPLHGWGSPKPGPHHDYINPKDCPENWLALDITIELEAKAKELAVLKLKRQLMDKGAFSN